MKLLRNVALSMIALSVGYALMVFAYDEPAWYRQLAGVSGAVLFFGSIVWLSKRLLSLRKKRV